MQYIYILYNFARISFKKLATFLSLFLITFEWFPVCFLCNSLFSIFHTVHFRPFESIEYTSDQPDLSQNDLELQVLPPIKNVYEYIRFQYSIHIFHPVGNTALGSNIKFFYHRKKSPWLFCFLNIYHQISINNYHFPSLSAEGYYFKNSSPLYCIQVRNGRELFYMLSNHLKVFAVKTCSKFWMAADNLKECRVVLYH